MKQWGRGVGAWFVIKIRDPGTGPVRNAAAKVVESCRWLI